MMSKLIETLGLVVAPDDLQSRINVMEAALVLYRRQLAKATEDTRRHGD